MLVAVALIVVILVLLGSTCVVEYESNSKGIDGAMTTVPVSHATVLAYLRAFEAALAKLTTLFLSFILIFVGTLYVLRTAQVNYDLTGEGQGGSVALRTSSPGLVMITLGVLALGLALYRLQLLISGTQLFQLQQPTMCRRFRQRTT